MLAASSAPILSKRMFRLNRYRNPDEDLPADFDARREEYYATLRLPQDAKLFVAG
jgi:hypothetical protein